MQGRLRATVVLCTTSMVIAGCVDRSAREPTAPTTPSSPSASVSGPLALTCDLTALAANAQAYAAASDDPLFGIIADLQPIVFHGRTAATTDLVFDGLARLAAMRGTNAQKSGATGAIFDAVAKGLLGCAESYITATIPATFSVAGALGPGWIFEVRGDDGQDPPTLGAYARGSTTFWAAEPQAGKTWGNSLTVTAPAGTTPTNRVLLYGLRLTDFQTIDPKAGTATDIATIPTIASGVLAFSPEINIGLCSLELNSTLRVQHIATILPNVELTCAAPPTFATAAAAPGRLAFSARSLARKAAGLFAPQPLFAAFLVGSVGGAVSELSPAAVIDMQSVTLEFAASVAKGTNSRPLEGADGDPVKVIVNTLNGSPLMGATVTLSADKNRSVIAFFRDGSAPPSVSVSRVTGADGVATFTGVSLTKAGGYRLVASGGFDGVEAAPVTSNLFNIQNK